MDANTHNSLFLCLPVCLPPTLPCTCSLTDCTDPAYNQGPAEGVLTLREMLNVAEIGLEDNFQGVYFCVDRNLDFRVLSELFDGVGSTNSRLMGSWPTGQNKWSSYPSLKVSSVGCVAMHGCLAQGRARHWAAQQVSKQWEHKALAFASQPTLRLFMVSLRMLVLMLRLVAAVVYFTLPGGHYHRAQLHVQRG